MAAVPHDRRHPCRGLSACPRAVALPLRGTALPPGASLPRRQCRPPVSGAGRRRDRRRRRHAQGVQRTWLDSRLPAKASVDAATPRKALGRIHGLCRVLRQARRRRFAARRRRHRDGAVDRHRGVPGFISQRPRSRPEASAPSLHLAGVKRASSSPATTIPEGERRPPNASPGAARGRASPPHVIVSEYGDDFNDDLVDLGSDTLGALAHSAHPLRWRKRRADSPASRSRREERVHGRRRQSEERAEAPRSIRVRACAQQHRADRPPHAMAHIRFGSAATACATKPSRATAPISGAASFTARSRSRNSPKSPVLDTRAGARHHCPAMGRSSPAPRGMGGLRSGGTEGRVKRNTERRARHNRHRLQAHDARGDRASIPAQIWSAKSIGRTTS